VVDSQVRSAVEAAAQRLGAYLETTVEHKHPPIGDTQAMFETLVAMDTDRAGLAAMAQQQGVVLSGWLAHLVAREWSADEFTAALMARKRIANLTWRFFQEFDFPADADHRGTRLRHRARMASRPDRKVRAKSQTPNAAKSSDAVRPRAKTTAAQGTVRKGEGHGVHYERLVPFGAGNLLEGNIHVIAPRGIKHDPITHQGETVGYVIQGQLELTIEGTLYLLHTGDSFFFKNHLSNSYRNLGARETRVLWVNTPQVH
jgi:quercetin dioxygenase-like cupin family protein